jgi:hypothetical protein
MHPKLTAILTLITIGILGTPSAQASSVIGVVKPNQAVKQGLQVNVSRTIDKNLQQYAFTVEIIAKNTELPDQFSTSLSIHHVTSHGESLNPLRKVPCSKRDGLRPTGGHRRITCNFTVPIQAIANPELVFLFDVPVVLKSNGKSIGMPSSSMSYFPLKIAVRP